MWTFDIRSDCNISLIFLTELRTKSLNRHGVTTAENFLNLFFSPEIKVVGFKLSKNTKSLKFQATIGWTFKTTNANSVSIKSYDSLFFHNSCSLLFSPIYFRAVLFVSLKAPLWDHPAPVRRDSVQTCHPGRAALIAAATKSWSN